MTNATEILREHGINAPSTPGRHYALCPQCSASRTTKEHRNAKVLGITIEPDGVTFGCNHCGWTGGGKINVHGQCKRKGANGHAHFIAEYVYRTVDGEPSRKVCRTADKQFPQFKWTGS